MQFLIIFGLSIVVVGILVLTDYLALHRSSKGLSAAIKESVRVHVPAPAPHNCLVTERGPGPLPVRPKGEMYIVALSDGTTSAANTVGSEDLPAAAAAAVVVLGENINAQLQVIPTFDLRLYNLASTRENRISIPESLRARIKGVQF